MKEKSTHTPGPWNIKAELNVMGYRGGSEATVATCGGYSTNRDAERVHEENIANARLISVAPDMLAVLSEVKAWYLSQAKAKMPVELCYALDAAIAKASGEGK